MDRYKAARLELALETAEQLAKELSDDSIRRHALVRLVFDQGRPDPARPVTLKRGFHPLSDLEERFIKFACALPRFTGKQRLQIATALDRRYVERQQAEYSKRTARPVTTKEN